MDKILIIGKSFNIVRFRFEIVDKLYKKYFNDKLFAVFISKLRK